MTTELADAFSFCKICRFNHTQKRKHIFTTKHKQEMKCILQKFGSKIKLSRPYLNNPVIQEGEYEPGSMFWCHCCSGNFVKHVTDRFKTILFGGVIEHLASNEHLEATEMFWHLNGPDKKFKTSFVISKTDFNLYKEKLVPLVDKYNDKKEEKTKELACSIKVQQTSRLFVNDTPDQFINNVPRVIYRTVRNKFGVLQNPTGYHDNVRVWKGGIMKYKQNSDQIIPSRYQSKQKLRDRNYSTSGRFLHTVSAEGEGLSKVTVNMNANHGNIHNGATPPWLRKDNETDEKSIAIGPSEEDFKKHLKRKEKSKLNPNRVGANFDHSTDKDAGGDWLPSFGRVWNQGARWKSRKEYHKEVGTKKYKKSE